MSGRTVPYDENAICDGCGRKGAFDFMGDLICPDCAEKAALDADSSDVKGAGDEGKNSGSAP